MDPHRMSDDNELIRSSLVSLKNATGIPVAMYGDAIEPGKIKIVHWVGLRTPALHDLVVEAGSGVGGRVLATRHPVGVSDYLRAKSITHEHDAVIRDEGLHSLVAVPVIVSRAVRGVLYAGVHSSVRLGNKVLEEITMTARTLEQDLAVADACRSSERGGAAKDRRSMNGAEWEQVRSTHSKLRMLANRIDDEKLRAEIEELCDQMVSPVRVKQTTKLSARELDVLACVALGHTNVEAAEEMGIGAETVKSYLRSVMRKLGAHTRYEAVNAARRIGALP